MVSKDMTDMHKIPLYSCTARFDEANDGRSFFFFFFLFPPNLLIFLTGLFFMDLPVSLVRLAEHARLGR